MSITHVLALAACLTAVPATTLAHDYWIEHEGRGFVLHQGHRHSGHAGAHSVAYDARTVAQVLCVDQYGKGAPLALLGNPVRAEGDCAAVRFELAGAYWTKTPWDTVNRPKTEVKGALKSWRSEQSVSRIERWSPMLASAGPGLGLSLAQNPARLRPNDEFAVIATLDGKPQAGVTIAHEGKTRGSSNADGHLTLRVRHRGLQSISASLETPLNDGKADRLIRSATLNFVLP